jgi:DNA-binding LacI/PurR family transcriptional regulator
MIRYPEVTMWQRSSAVSLLAAHLRGELERGRWQGKMPGVIRLARELGAARKTVEGALREMEKECLLVAQGHGRGRVIATQKPDGRRPPLQAGLRIRILLYEESDAHDELTAGLRHRLEERGHQVSLVPKTLVELRFDVNRVAKLVNGTGGDAWVIRAGSSPVLEWFAAQNVPAFAMYGRQSSIPMASVATFKPPAAALLLRKLVDLGHRRIVMLAREERRKPMPALFEEWYLEELGRLGIEVGPYNLPDWENSRLGFHRCMDTLFRHTPPTALLLGESPLFFAAQQYLAGKGLYAPRDVSLISVDDNPAFEWLEPMASHIHVDTRRVVPRVVEWANHVASGREDRRKTIIRAEFVEGGTIGPVPSR